MGQKGVIIQVFVLKKLLFLSLDVFDINFGSQTVLFLHGLKYACLSIRFSSKYALLMLGSARRMYVFHL